jgi:hypothetical protein
MKHIGPCSKAVQTNAQLLTTWTIMAHMSRTTTGHLYLLHNPVRFDHGTSHLRAHWSHLVGPIARDNAEATQKLAPYRYGRDVVQHQGHHCPCAYGVQDVQSQKCKTG